MTDRRVRYQGAIVQDHHILLLHGREGLGPGSRQFWLLPGGGREADETEEQALRRELLEETHLEVKVERLLMSRGAHSSDEGAYEETRTYLCTPVRGVAAPGIEPEVPPEQWAILAVDWFDLRDEAGWGAEVLEDPITYDQLVEIRRILGYAD